MENCNETARQAFAAGWDAGAGKQLAVAKWRIRWAAFFGVVVGFAIGGIVL